MCLRAKEMLKHKGRTYIYEINMKEENDAWNENGNDLVDVSTLVGLLLSAEEIDSNNRNNINISKGENSLRRLNAVKRESKRSIISLSAESWRIIDNDNKRKLRIKRKVISWRILAHGKDY